MDDIHAHQNPIRRQSEPFPLILIGGGVLLLLLLTVLSLLFFYKSQKLAEARIQGVEKRLERMEGFRNQLGDIGGRLDGLESQNRSLQTGLAELKALAAPLPERVQRLEKQLAHLEKQLARAGAAETKPPSEKKPRQTAKPATPESGYHEVKAGDTLYSISRRYQLKLETLRKLNDLSPQDPIRPGQKLKISPKESN